MKPKEMTQEEYDKLTSFQKLELELYDSLLEKVKRNHKS